MIFIKIELNILNRPLQLPHIYLSNREGPKESCGRIRRWNPDTATRIFKEFNQFSPLIFLININSSPRGLNMKEKIILKLWNPETFQ